MSILQSPSENSDSTSLQDSSGPYTTPSEGGTDVDTNIVLRVECLSKYLLKVRPKQVIWLLR